MDIPSQHQAKIIESLQAELALERDRLEECLLRHSAAEKELAALKAQQGEPVARYVDEHDCEFVTYCAIPVGSELYLAPPNTEALRNALKVARDALTDPYRATRFEKTHLAIAAIDALLGDKPCPK